MADEFKRVGEVVTGDGELVVHFGGGNPRDWIPQPGKMPSLGTLQYVRNYYGDDEDEAAVVMERVFPDARSMLDEMPTIRSRDARE